MRLCRNDRISETIRRHRIAPAVAPRTRRANPATVCGCHWRKAQHTKQLGKRCLSALLGWSARNQGALRTVARLPVRWHRRRVGNDPAPRMARKTSGQSFKVVNRQAGLDTTLQKIIQPIRLARAPDACAPPRQKKLPHKHLHSPGNTRVAIPSRARWNPLAGKRKTLGKCFQLRKTRVVSTSPTGCPSHPGRRRSKRKCEKHRRPHELVNSGPACARLRSLGRRERTNLNSLDSEAVTQSAATNVQKFVIFIWQRQIFCHTLRSSKPKKGVSNERC